MFSDEINVGEGKFKNGKFNFKQKTRDGEITSLEFDVYRNTFSIIASSIDLTGLQSPIRFDIEIGDYYGYGIAYDSVDKIEGSGGQIDVINGRGHVPMQLLMNYQDSLRVDKCVFRLGRRKPNTDFLMVTGGFAVENSDIKDIIVRWGDYDVTLPAGSLYEINRGIKYKKSKGSNSSVAVAMFDFEKGTFNIIIKNANIGNQGNAIDFGIKFDAFDEADTIELKVKKANNWIFP